LKAGWLTPKPEVSGLALGLADTTAVAGAHADMVARLGEGEYVLEEMDSREAVVESLVGGRRDEHCGPSVTVGAGGTAPRLHGAGRRDESFGPIVMVGAGGTETELYGDTWLELAPVSHTEALEMISRLTCYRLLTGWRGRPAADLDGLAEAIVAVSRLIASNNEIAELEINPVRVAESGALAVDALVVTDTTKE